MPSLTLNIHQQFVGQQGPANAWTSLDVSMAAPSGPETQAIEALVAFGTLVLPPVPSAFVAENFVRPDYDPELSEGAVVNLNRFAGGIVRKHLAEMAGLAAAEQILQKMERERENDRGLDTESRWQVALGQKIIESPVMEKAHAANRRDTNQLAI